MRNGRSSKRDLQAIGKHPIAFSIWMISFGIFLLIIGLTIADDMFVLMLILALIFMLIGIIVLISVYVNNKRLEARQLEIAHAGYDKIDKLTGREFEQFLAVVFEKNGYSVKTTRTTGDYGADLIMEKNGKSIAVQCKHSINKISVSAVQEVKSAIAHYHVGEGWVVTNNFFTKPAQNLASENNITLIDRYELSKYINATNQKS